MLSKRRRHGKRLAPFPLFGCVIVFSCDFTPLKVFLPATLSAWTRFQALPCFVLVVFVFRFVFPPGGLLVFCEHGRVTGKQFSHGRMQVMGDTDRMVRQIGRQAARLKAARQQARLDFGTEYMEAVSQVILLSDQLADKRQQVSDLKRRAKQVGVDRSELNLLDESVQTAARNVLHADSVEDDNTLSQEPEDEGDASSGVDE